MKLRRSSAPEPAVETPTPEPKPVPAPKPLRMIALTADPTNWEAIDGSISRLHGTLLCAGAGFSIYLPDGCGRVDFTDLHEVIIAAREWQAIRTRPEPEPEAPA